MNCPTCKNPIQENSKECEWCGNEILSGRLNNANPDKHIKFIFNGMWFLVDTYTEIYLNDEFYLKSSVKKGFSFEILNTVNLPEIKLKISFKSKIIKLPRLEQNRDYIIELDYSRAWGNYSDTPKSIIQV